MTKDDWEVRMRRKSLAIPPFGNREAPKNPSTWPPRPPRLPSSFSSPASTEPPRCLSGRRRSRDREVGTPPNSNAFSLLRPKPPRSEFRRATFRPGGVRRHGSSLRQQGLRHTPGGAVRALRSRNAFPRPLLVPGVPAAAGAVPLVARGGGGARHDDDDANQMLITGWYIRI